MIGEHVGHGCGKKARQLAEVTRDGLHTRGDVIVREAIRAVEGLRNQALHQQRGMLPALRERRGKHIELYGRGSRSNEITKVIIRGEGPAVERVGKPVDLSGAAPSFEPFTQRRLDFVQQKGREHSSLLHGTLMLDNMLEPIHERA